MKVVPVLVKGHMQLLEGLVKSLASTVSILVNREGEGICCMLLV
jgi:hypothetical protein